MRQNASTSGDHTGQVIISITTVVISVTNIERKKNKWTNMGRNPLIWA